MAKVKQQNLWHQRFSAFNENVRAVAKKYPVILFEAKDAEFLNDRRFLAFDRLHMNSEGHRRLAQAVLAGLEKPHDKDWREPLPPAKKKNKFISTAITTAWIITFVSPLVIGGKFEVSHLAMDAVENLRVQLLGQGALKQIITL
jgi:hypothetical protein